MHEYTHSDIYTYICVCVSHQLTYMYMYMHMFAYELHERINEEKADLIVVTEAWFTSDITEAELHLHGLTSFRYERSERWGGELIVYVKSSLKPLPLNTRLSDNVGAVVCKLSVDDENLQVLSIYHSPSSTSAEDQYLIEID